MKRTFISTIAFIIFSVQVIAQIPSIGLAAWYPFSGNANDASGNGNNGVNNGATLATDRFSNPNASYLLDGVNDFINVPHSLSLSFTDEITIAFWIKKSSANLTGMVPISKRGYNDNQQIQYLVQLNFDYGATMLYSGVNAPSPYYEGFKPSVGIYNTFNDGNWHFLVFQHKYNTTGNSKVYLDNNYLTSTYTGWYLQFNYAAVITTAAMFLGKQNSSSTAWYCGYLDDIRFYNRILSPAEIQQLYTENGWGLPAVTTNAATNILENSAVLGGNVTSAGSSAVTTRGVCWNTQPNPTVANNVTTNGSGTGTFSSTLTGLAPVTQYYARAYATNGYGTAYGNEVTFTTLGSLNPPCPGVPTFTYSGKTYNTILIGQQCWMKENLNIGTKINGTSNQTNNTIIEKYCYNNDTNMCNTYGGLYQWNEMMNYSTSSNANPSGRQGICPTGWHIPSDAEWCQLSSFLDVTVNCNTTGFSGTTAGGKLKEPGTSHWTAPNTGATNSSGFTGLPGGFFALDRQFYDLHTWGYFQTSTEQGSDQAFFQGTYYNNALIYRTSQSSKNQAFSVRCLKDCSTLGSPTSGTHIPGTTHVIWNWNTVTGAIGYKWNTVNNYTTATDMGTATSKTETGLACGTAYTRYVWAYNTCGYSTATTLSQSTTSNPVSISISASANPVCAGTSVIFTAVPVNGGTAPLYQWKVNGMPAGSNNPIFTTIPVNGAIVTCTLTSNISCPTGNPAISNSITMTVVPDFLTGSAASSQVICEGTSPEIITGSAPQNGVNPSYQWQTSSDNAIFSNIPGATSISYQPGILSATTYFRQLQNASGTCGGPLPTNTVTITVNPLPDSPVSGGNQTVCSLNLPAVLGATTPAGCTIDWYAVSAGGTVLLTSSNTFATSVAGTYYAQSRDTATGCNSSSRTPITLGIVPATLYYFDADSDGYGSTTPAMLCSQTPPQGYSTNNLDCDDTNPAVNPAAQHFAFTGTSGFASSLVSPATGSPYTTFHFEGEWFDLTNAPVPAGYPRLILDFEGNGIYTDPNDRTIIMSPSNVGDTTTSDGKRFFAEVTGLPYGTSWQARLIVSDDGSCITTFGPFNTPDVLQAPNLSIFADDITFSNYHPVPSSNIQVSAVIHNESDYLAQNFIVRLVNQFDTTLQYPYDTVYSIPPHQQTIVQWNITTPSIPAWCPIQIRVDATNVIAETNELDNTAVRPFLNGNYQLPGSIDCIATVVPSSSFSSPNNTLLLSGHAYYSGTVVPLPDPGVAGALVEFTITETQTTFTGYTDASGHFMIYFISPVSPGEYHITGSVTDFTLTGTFNSYFFIESPVIVLKPDLVTSMTVSPNNIYPGGSVNGTAIVTNAGNGANDEPTVLIFSQTGGNPVIESIMVPPLTPGQSYTAQFSQIVFENSGTYVICATADGSNLVTESNEGNNAACATIYVTAIPPANPNLTISGCRALSVQPINPSYPGFATLTARVLNTGNQTATGPIQVKFIYSSGEIYTSQYGLNLSPGQSVDISAPASLPEPASTLLTAQVDPLNLITESNESDNISTGNMCWDFQPAALSNPCGYNFWNYSYFTNQTINVSTGLIASHLYDAQPVKVRFEVKTPGSSVFSTLGDEFLSTVSRNCGQCPYLVNLSSQYTFTVAGTYTFRMSADPDDDYTECNEDNNVLLVTVNVSDPPPPRPNLTISGCRAIEVRPVDPLYPSVATLAAHVSNTGNAVANSPVKVKFSYSTGETFFGQSNADLASEASAEITVTAPLPPPATTILSALVDPFNEISESNENDNSASGDMCWDFQPMPPCGTAFWSQDYQVNQSVYLATGLWVSHLYDASTVKVRFEVTGPGINGTQNLGTRTVNNVSGNCYNCPYTVGLPVPYTFFSTGTYTFTMTADPEGVYSECDETNNVMVVTVDVTGPLPDMRVLSQYIYPSLLNPSPGQPVSLAITYDNIGSQNVSDVMKLKVIADTSGFDSVYPVNGLFSGDHATIAIPLSWSSNVPGLHVIRAKIDADNQVSESNETNNEGTRAIIVGQAANLYFQAFFPSDWTPLLNEPILIHTRIGNAGAQNCNASVRFSYLGNQGDTVTIGQYSISIQGYDSVTITLPWTVSDTTATIIGTIFNTSVLEFNYGDNMAMATLGSFNIVFSSTPGCIAGSPGSLTATPSGGVPPYSYTWSNGYFGQTLTGPAGNYSVTVHDNVGHSKTVTDAISSLIPPVPSISGPVSVCSTAASGMNYSTEPGMSGYSWTISTGGTIVSGLSTNNITVNWNSAGNHWLAANYANSEGCMAALPTMINISVISPPPAAGSISGPTLVVQGQTNINFSVAPVPGTTSYNWTFPTGFNIINGASTHQVSVNILGNAVSGNVFVQPVNNCGTGGVSPNHFVTVQMYTPTSVTLQNLTFPSGQSQCFGAIQSILVAGNGSSFLVNGGGSVTLIAGSKIRIFPLTKVNSGGYMHCFITDNGQYCTSLKTAITENSEISEPYDQTIPFAIGQNFFRLFPNPTPSSFTLELREEPDRTGVEIEIYNLLGETILRDEFNEGRLHRYSLADRQPGIYLIRVTRNGMTGTGKVIRQ